MKSKRKILIFSGAGLDKESGISTFRDSVDGLWNTHKIEDVCTSGAWKRDRKLVLDFYNERRGMLPTTFPNKAHQIITDLEKYFDVTIVTQNVTDLHERSGSSKIIHLHGELTKARGCLYENKSSPLDSIVDIGYTPISIGDMCPVTGSQLRPHIVFFGEELNSQDLLSANNAAKDADVCIVVGTSMQVAPANLIPFLTKETALIYYVDPGNMGFSIPYNRESLFQHYKEIASVGMKKVYDDLIEIFLEK